MEGVWGRDVGQWESPDPFVLDRQPLYQSGGWGTQELISVERVPGRGFGSIEGVLSAEPQSPRQVH